MPGCTSASSHTLRFGDAGPQALPGLLVVQRSEQGTGVGLAVCQLAFDLRKQLISGQGPVSIRIQRLDKS